MADAGDLDVLSRKMYKLAAGFTGPARERVIRKLDKPLQADVERAVKGDIGDLSMSGWRRGKPIQITPVVKVSDDLLSVAPQGRAIGPMRVLTDGRNAAGGFQGPGVNARTGATKRTKRGNVSKVRARRGFNGTTQGKGTWDDAVKLMEATAPKVLEKAVLDEVGEAFGGR